MENHKQITISDLDVIKNIIDLACTRGAFRAGEVSQVGAAYDKLNAFLEATIAEAQEYEASKNADAGEPKGE